MENQPKLPKKIQFIISIFVIFIVFHNTIIAQQSYQDIVNRVDEIDSEINSLTLLREHIGMEFKIISDFSIEARPILTTHDKYEEAIGLKKEELTHMFLNREVKAEKEAELQFLEAHRDDHYIKYTESGGVFSNIGKVKVQSKTIEELQKEYNRVSNYYLEKKTQYDDIALELGKLNTEKHNLEIKLKYMGDDQGVIPLDPTGCWKLKFGNHISEITVSKHESGKYVGTLTVNNLQDYEDGQVVFIIDRVSDTTFKGIEYTWEEKPNSIIGEAKIPVMITINTDNNYLTWTSDQTVTMSRCR